MPLTDLLRPRREFPLPSFDLAPLEFGPNDELALEALADSIGPLPEAVEPTPVPTAGKLREKIETHLRLAEQGQLATEASEELRYALAQLRRSVG